MQFKRNWLSYIVWGIAMVTMGIIAYQYANIFNANIVYPNIQAVISIPFIYEIGLALTIILLLIVSGGLFVAFYKISSAIAKKSANSVKSDLVSKICKVFIAIVLLGAAVAYRYYLMMGNLGNVEFNSLFEAAKITMSSGTGNFAGSENSLTYIYVSVLSVFMLFFGNGAYSVVVMNFAFQILNIILIFVIAKKMFGYIAGLLSAVFLAFIPYYSDKILLVHPSAFLQSAFLLGILLVISLLSIKNNALRIIYGIISGLIIGCFIYLDGLNLILLLFIVFAIVYEAVNKKAFIKVLPFALMFLGVACGFLVVIFADSFSSKTTFEAVIYCWWYLFSNAAFPQIILFSGGTITFFELYLCFGLLIPIIWAMIGFWTEKTDDAMLIRILFIALAPTMFTCSGYLHDNSIAIVIYAIMVGLGVSCLFFKASVKESAGMDAAFDYIEKIEENALAEENAETDSVASENENTETLENIETTEDTETTEIAEDTESTEDTASRENSDSIENLVLEETASEEIVEAEKEEVQAEDKNPEDKEEAAPEEIVSEETTQLKNGVVKNNNDNRKTIPQVDDLPGMIPNPLPLPARKAHSQIDYKYDVSDEMMHFDITIDEDDNFDI